MTIPLYGFVVLAAGNSSRLGQPKALLAHGGTTMIGHTLQQIARTGWPTVVVTGGANISHALAEHAVTVAHNIDWREGMASSIRCGLAALLEQSPVDAVMFAVCDQPAVSTELFLQLMRTQEREHKGIVASAYAGTCGIPVLFHRRYFPSLLTLSGTGGAKALLDAHAADVAQVSFAEGAIDIDTREDYDRWRAHASAALVSEGSR